MSAMWLCSSAAISAMSPFLSCTTTLSHGDVYLSKLTHQSLSSAFQTALKDHDPVPLDNVCNLNGTCWQLLLHMAGAGICRM